jgi:hypothetical protein
MCFIISYNRKLQLTDTAQRRTFRQTKETTKPAPVTSKNLDMQLARKWDGDHLLAYSRIERGDCFVLLNRSQIAEKPECRIFGPRVVAGKNGIFGIECVILQDKHSRRFPPDGK